MTMAIIITTARNTWQATFNRRDWRIVGGQAKMIKRATDETRSLLRFWQWHVASRREVSELATIFAMADGLKNG